MARLEAIGVKQAPWHLRWFYRATRKMLGKPITAATIYMRVPGVMWGGILMDGALGAKRHVSLRLVQLAKVRTAARVGCPF